MAFILMWRNNRPVMDKIDTYSLRGICMLMIIVHHVYKVFVSDYGYSSNMMDRFWGDLGTGVFFLLSGYGLFCSLSTKDCKSNSYLGGVIRKMIVPFVVAFIISLISKLIACPEELSLNLCRDFATLTIPDTTTWFFKVICAYYLICLLVFAFVPGIQIRILIVAVCTLAYFFCGKYIFHFSPYLFCTTINFPLGMIYAAHRNGIKFNEKLFGIFISLVAFCLVLKYSRDCSLALYSPAFSFLSVFVCSKINIANRLFDFIGRNSLVFYLFHIAILHQLCLCIHNEWMLLFLIISITFALAVIYNYVERMIKSCFCTL